MIKPATQDGYSEEVTKNCERVLVTLLSGLGPWKESVYLVGGLAPRYLVPDRPPKVAPHAGTGDVDIVVELEMLAETDAYHTLEENLKKMGFERSENQKGEKLSWRWQTRTETGAIVILELLADNPEVMGGKVQPLPTEGSISALNIPHSSMVFEHYETVKISAELLGGNGIATETIRYADLVSFTCLKAFAFNQRHERKDAHDLTYCIQYARGGLDAAAAAIRAARAGKHAGAVDQALGILKARFVEDEKTEGYQKDGPVAVAKFELGEAGGNEEMREEQILRQRNVADLIGRLIKLVG